ncbi:esterase/lipase family protein [Ramlibacter sp. PS4R-6]|uniref:esterase/lipase family protein n=1 Tax=Ramlibacter sp. PS4R-6 TaxID=3133438 RepID=UPI0030B1B06B
MPSHSALARLQQVIAVGLLAVALAWFAWRWPASPAWAVLGALAIVFSYSFFLAAEFVLLKTVGARDPAPRPSWGDAVRAWWGETCTTPRVFFWRQPFRWRAEPDFLEETARGKRGVVFIHGFVCNRGFWNPWMAQFRAAGIPFAAVNLEPVFGSIDAYRPIVDEAIERVRAATGLAPVLVCHSMGGLAARAWLRGAGDAGRVHHVVTIGTPHHGTWLGHFSHTGNGRQMRLDGPWVEQLAQAGVAAPFTCWYSNCDNIVFPVSTATLPGADNRLVPGIAHVQLGFRPEIVAATRELLAAPS